MVGDDWDDSTFVWYETIYQFRRVGYSIDYFVDFSISSDLKNSTGRVIDVQSLNIPFIFIFSLFTCIIFDNVLQ